MSNEIKDGVVRAVSEETEAVSHSEHSSHHHGHHGEHHHHHSHKHHSKHHRRRHHHKKQTTKEKLKAFFQKPKKGLSIAATVICVLLLIVVLVLENIQINPSKNNGTGAAGEDSTQNLDTGANVYIGTPLIDGEIFLIGDAAKEYMASDISVHIKDIYDKYKGTGKRLDAGVPFEVKFEISGLPSQVRVANAQLELSETTNFASSVFYELDNNYSVSVYNLKTGTTYSYRAVFTLTNGSTITRGGNFTTATSPRIMTIDGMYNVRDIGGWKTVDGIAVKQGLLYRGTELDSAVEDKYLITQDGINELLLNLGVKTDMDLRAPSDRMPGQYVLGTNVDHKYYDAMMYDGIFTAGGSAGVKAIFRDLANPANYPIYLHCTYGCDRTGTVCYLLGALLGVSENDLIRDYELSGLFASQIDRENIKTLYSELQNYTGFTLQEKVENYLLSIGVTAEEIRNLKYIFLG